MVKIRLNWRKFIAFIAMVIAAAILLWIAASWMEVVLKNTTVNPRYSERNFWVNLVTVSATVTSVQNDVVTIKVGNDFYCYYAESPDVEVGDSIRVVLHDGRVENAF